MATQLQEVQPAAGDPGRGTAIARRPRPPLVAGRARQPRAAAPWRRLDVQEVRRLRYFRDLMRMGYDGALHHGVTGETLRSERLALRIALPELDAVPSWSAKRGDGMIAIPFIEFILGQVLRSVERLDVAVEERAGLRRTLLALGGGAAKDGPLPRLNDVFVPPALIERLCRQGGLLDRIVKRTEDRFGAATGEPLDPA